uniref:C-type lectin domain-containing protein n=1 Tax=Plectus sambesii TaxID=2011161 RepID=A0A914UZD8_9BILA
MLRQSVLYCLVVLHAIGIQTGSANTTHNETSHICNAFINSPRAEISCLRDKISTLIAEIAYLKQRDQNDILPAETSCSDIDCQSYINSASQHVWKGNKYMYVREWTTWYDAEKICVHWGGHLASVKNEEENGMIEMLTFDSLWVSIGFNDVKTEGVFAWTDGSNNTFTNWRSYESQARNGRDKNCAAQDKDGQWWHENCYMKNRFVCKRPATREEMQPRTTPRPRTPEQRNINAQ